MRQSNDVCGEFVARLAGGLFFRADVGDSKRKLGKRGDDLMNPRGNSSAYVGVSALEKKTDVCAPGGIASGGTRETGGLPAQKLREATVVFRQVA